MKKVELSFYSKMLPSKRPVGILNEREVFYKVRHTTAKLMVTNGKEVNNYSATVSCNLNDQDITVLGQKHAVAKLLQTIGNVDKDFKTLVWDSFFTHSKEARKLMGRC